MLHILSKSSRAPVVGILPTPAPPRWGGETLRCRFRFTPEEIGRGRSILSWLFGAF